MKKQNVAANDAKKEQMEISELIKHMLIREKEQHGHSKGILVLIISQIFKDFFKIIYYFR